MYWRRVSLKCIYLSKAHLQNSKSEYINSNVEIGGTRRQYKDGKGAAEISYLPVSERSGTYTIVYSQENILSYPWWNSAKIGSYYEDNGIKDIGDRSSQQEPGGFTLNYFADSPEDGTVGGCGSSCNADTMGESRHNAGSHSYSEPQRKLCESRVCVVGWSQYLSSTWGIEG